MKAASGDAAVAPPEGGALAPSSPAARCRAEIGDAAVAPPEGGALAPSSLAGRWVAKLDDALNPIVVRELRQAVQGKALAVILLLFLAVEVLTVGGYALFSPAVFTPGAFSEAGRSAFLVLLGILLFVSLLFVPFYTGVRMSVERSGELDLLYVTTLSPRAIVAGKLAAGALLTGFLFSSSLPFMTFTYFLRGVDLPSIFVVLGLGFLTVFLFVQLAVLVAALPASRIFKVVLGLVMLGQTFGSFGMLMGSSYELLRGGVGSRLGSWDFWGPALSVLVAYAALSRLLFVVAVAALTPAAADRARPVRLTLAVTWLVTAAGAVLGSELMADPALFAVWLAGMSTVLILALLGAASERDDAGPRLRRTIPSAGPRRFLAFLLTSGNAGGLLFTTALLAATLALGTLYQAHLGSRAGDLEKVRTVLLGFAAYAFCYALLGLFLRRRLPFLARVSPGHTWVVSLILVALGSWLPIVAVFLLLKPALHEATTFYPWLALNPFSMLETGHRDFYLRLAGTWCAATAVASLPWLVGRWRRFGREL